MPPFGRAPASACSVHRAGEASDRDRRQYARLSSGETELKLPKIGANDEIASMTRAVSVFRDAALERERLERQAESSGCWSRTQRRQASEEQRKNEEERRKNAEQQQHAAARAVQRDWQPRRRDAQAVRGRPDVRLDAETFGSYRRSPTTSITWPNVSPPPWR